MASLTASPTVDVLARAGARNIAASVVSAGSGVALVLAVTNTLPRDVSGILFASSALFLVLVSLCVLGTDVGLARWVPRYLVAEQDAAARQAFRVAARPVAAVSSVAGLALFVLAPQVGDLIVTDTASAHVDDLVTALRILALCLPVAAMYDLVIAATRAHGAILPTIICERLGRSVLQLLAVVGVCIAGGGAVALVTAWAAPYGIALVAAVVWLARVRGPADAGAVETESTDDVARSFWRFTSPRAVGQLLQVALQRIDIVVVSATLGVRQAAVYAAATRFLVFGQITTQAVQQVLQPQLSTHLAQQDVAATDRAFRSSTAWIMAMAWPVYLSFAVLAPVVVKVFGDGYDGGESTVLILSLTMLLATAAGPVDVLLLMSGRSTTSMLNGAAALVIDVVLLLILTPHIGITGAAIAWSAAIVVRNVLPFVQVRRSLGVTVLGKATTTVAAVIAIPFAVTAPIVRWGLDNGHPEAGVLVAVALAAAAAGLWRTRHVTGVDAMVDAFRRS